MNSDASQQPAALEELFAEIEREEPAAIDSSSAEAIIGSLGNSVVPAMRRRVERIKAACERFVLRTGFPWSDSERRIGIEEDACELMTNMSERLVQFTHLIGSDDVLMLESASHAVLSGESGAPALDAVKVYVRVKARANIVSAHAAKLLWSIIEAQQQQERMIADIAMDLALSMQQGEMRHDLIQRLEREGELYRELAQRGIRVDGAGLFVTAEQERLGSDALRTAEATHQYGAALLMLDTICDEVEQEHAQARASD